MKQNLLLILCISSLLAGCKKVDHSKTGFAHLDFFTTAFVNPGDPGQKNSSIDLYSPFNDSIWYDAYRSIHGKSLGTYVSEGQKVGDEYWLIAPNEDKIIILSSWDLAPRGEILGIQFPQCIEVSPSHVYVGSKEKQAMYAIDISSHAVTEIPLTYANVTDIEFYDEGREDLILVACHDPRCQRMYVTTPGASSLTDSIYLNSRAPYQIAYNSWGYVSVLCGSEDSQLPWRLDQNRMFPGSSTGTFSLSSDYSYGKMVSTLETGGNLSNDELFILGKGKNGEADALVRFSDNGTAIEEAGRLYPNSSQFGYSLINFFSAPNRNVYFVGYNDQNDALSYRNLDNQYSFNISEIPLRDTMAIVLFRQ